MLTPWAGCDPPGLPRQWRGRLREVDRHCLRGPAVDAAVAFLTDAGFPVGDLADPTAPPAPYAGAALLLGGGIGVPDAAATPCPDVPDVAVVLYRAADSTAGPAAPGPARVGEWQRSWPVADHAAAVAAVRAAVARGDLYQANLVAHRSAAFAGDPAAVATALARVPGTPYAGSLAGAGWLVATASPESFLAVRAGVARVRPIKGTRPRGATPAADAAAATALRASAKDRAEHVMIVDLERNDLGRVARVGGVRVPELYAVRRLAGLWHAESTVEADLAPGVGLAELLRATFPGGSVTGAPKLAALAEIARREPTGRGPSMGAFGWIGADGSVELGLTIRTVAVAAGRVHLWTGGGVTWGSRPADEVAEADAKAAPLLAALAALGTGPGTGAGTGPGDDPGSGPPGPGDGAAQVRPSRSWAT